MAKIMQKKPATLNLRKLKLEGVKGENL